MCQCVCVIKWEVLGDHITFYKIRVRHVVAMCAWFICAYVGAYRDYKDWMYSTFINSGIEENVNTRTAHGVAGCCAFEFHASCDAIVCDGGGG